MQVRRQSQHKATFDNAQPEAALSDGRDAFLGFLARRLGNRAEAEDVLQDFCLKVMERKDQLRDVERMDAWLYAVLRSTLTDYHRGNSRRKRLHAAFGREVEGLAEEPAELKQQLCTCVTGLVRMLRPADAELVQRLDFGDEDRAVVAADLGITRGALAVRLHRARTSLRDILLDHCGPCCQSDFEDCSCTSVGCENTSHRSHCGSRSNCGPATKSI